MGRKWTLDTQVGMNFFFYTRDATSSRYKAKKFSHWLVQPELRYWTCDVFNGWFFGLHAHGGQMVDKATRGRTDCAGLTVIGRHRGYVAHNARAMIERLLQALLGMVIDDRRAQRVQVERDGTVVDFAFAAADNVACTFAERRDRHAVRIAQAAVDDNRRGLAVFALSLIHI